MVIMMAWVMDINLNGNTADYLWGWLRQQEEKLSHRNLIQRLSFPGIIFLSFSVDFLSLKVIYSHTDIWPRTIS